MTMIARVFSWFCVATVLTQVLIAGVLAVRGSLTPDNATKIVGLMNGIDISGDRVAAKITEAKQRPVPSYEETLEERARMGLQMDMRRRSLENYHNQLLVIQERLRLEQSRFDTRKDAFYRKLDELAEGGQDEAILTRQKTLEALPPAISKDQMIRMIDDGDLNGVVAIVKAMSADKRKKVLREFVSPEEANKLQEILQRMGEGDPEKSLIDNARAE